MNISVGLTLSKKSVDTFTYTCKQKAKVIGNLGNKAITNACKELMEMSLVQVPRASGTLASSIYYEVSGSYQSGFVGTVGYGGNGDPVNPTGKHASEYMLAVHENLYALHSVGKAKFLEDPVKEYASGKFITTIIKYLQEGTN
jgi:hypothetical protein